MTGWWGDEPAEQAGPAGVPDSAKLAALGGFEPSVAHDPGGVAALPAADAVALAGLTGLVPGFVTNQALGERAAHEAEVERLVAERRSDRERERREAREGLVAAGLLESPAQAAARVEQEHAKAYRDLPDPEPDEFRRYGELPDRYRSGGDPEPVAVDPVLAEAQALEADSAHRSVLLEAKRRRVAAGRQRMATRAQARTVSRSRPAGPVALSVCGDPRCECGGV